MKQNGESSMPMHSKNANSEELLLQQTAGYNYQKGDLCDREGTSRTLQQFRDANIRDTNTLSSGSDIQYLEQNPFHKLPFRIIKTNSQDEDSQYVHCRSVFDIISISGNCAGSFRGSSKNYRQKLEQKFGYEQVSLLESGHMPIRSHFEMSKYSTENERHVAAGCDFVRPVNDHVHMVGLNEPSLHDTMLNGKVSSDDKLVGKIYDSAKQELLSLQVNTTIKEDICMKCNKGGKLFKCKCGMIVHEKCLGMPIEIRNPESFSCAFCTHRNAVVALGKVFNDVCHTKKNYNTFLENRGWTEFEGTLHQQTVSHPVMKNILPHVKVSPISGSSLDINYAKRTSDSTTGNDDCVIIDQLEKVVSDHIGKDSEWTFIE